MKPLIKCLYRCCLFICCCLVLAQKVRAQTVSDGLMIQKNFFCIGSMYSYNSWTNYWEGTFKRDNGNIGRLTTNTYNVFGNYGITNRLDVLFSVPYVTTNASAGTLKGQSGFQDLMISLKWLPYKAGLGGGIFSTYVILSGTTPLSNYEPDFEPMSIGMHSETASLRALLNYQYGRFFVAAAGQYIRRDNITIDRTSYFTTELINSSEVDVPNANNLLFSAGYRSSHFNAEALFEQNTTLGGFDIRKNDMPFVSNTMNATMAGALFKYSFNRVAGLELTTGGNYVLKGRNVGQATTVFGGVLYLFDVRKR